MNEDLFYKCSEINDYLIDGDEPKARDLLIQLLDYVGRNNIQYFPLLKRLSQNETAFFVFAKKIGQVLTSLSQNLPVSLIFCILGNQVKISQR